MNTVKNDKLIDALNEYMSAYSRQWNIHCTVLAAKDGQILFNNAYGLANQEHKVPNGIDTLFWLASITKTFTAAAIMMLHEQGLADVNDSIGKYLDEYPWFDKGVTIHHLLTHTSGIVNYSDLSNWENEIKRLHYSEAEFAALLKDKPLQFPPGEKASYSNTGFYLLSIIIQKVSGMSYEAFVIENMIRKAGLQNTGFVKDDEIVLNMANGYIYNGPVLVKAPYSEMTKIQASGGLYSTCKDLHQFFRCLSNGQLIAEESLELMYKNHHNGHGYGCFIGENIGRKTIYHNGSYCGFLGQYVYYPADDVFICVLSNNSYTNVWRLCDELAAITLEVPVAKPSKPSSIKEINSEFNEYIGVYQGEPDFKITITRNADTFNLRFNNDNLYTIYPTAKDTFQNELLDEKYNFERDENGKLSLWGCVKVNRPRA